MSAKRVGIVICNMLIFVVLNIAATGVMVKGATVITYPAPSEAEGASDFQVQVDGKEVFVYHSKVAAFAYFSFSGNVKVEVTTNKNVNKVDVRPKSHSIESVVNKKTIHFNLTKPCNLSIEINRDIKRPLFLIANPIENDPPRPGDKNVRYFEGGKIHDVGKLSLKNNETIYIAGGAIVRGAIDAKDVKNARVIGHGILDGSNYEHCSIDKTLMILLEGCSDIQLDGIIVLNSPCWTIVPARSDRISITNVKLIGWRNNDDGIDIVGSRNVKIDGCFLRTKDDCIAIKAFFRFIGWPRFTLSDWRRDVKDIRVTNSVIWNAEWGNALEIGFELQTKSISDILFKDCDIIHVQRGAVFSIHNGDFATVENIRYENIQVEDAGDELVDFGIFLSRYSGDCPKNLKRSGAIKKLSEDEARKYINNRGYIKNIYFKNIRVSGNNFPKSPIKGFYGDHIVEDVTFEGLWIHDKQILNGDDGRFSIEKAKNIKFISTDDNQ